MPIDVYTSRNIAQIVEGRLIEGENPDAPVYYLLTDSRKIISAKSDLFFAITTSRNDGHKYVHDLLEKGLQHFVIKEVADQAWLQYKACFIIVNDPLQALQKLAAYHRERFSVPVIGITGSNGKTIVKEWLWQLIGNDKRVVRSPRSYNSQIGVPLSVWQMSGPDDMAIFEAGISMPGEMRKLEPVIRPTLGIFTNIGPAHDENFSSILQKATEKFQLFRQTDEVICCADHDSIMMAYEHLSWDHKPRLVAWSNSSSGADLIITNRSKVDGSTLIHGLYHHQKLQIEVPFTDQASLENAVFCWLTLLYLGFDPEIIASRMLQLQPIAMRMELKEGVNNCTLIDDSYSSDLSSLGIALDFIDQQQQHSKKTLILSDIQQSGMGEENLYASLGEMVFSRNLHRFIGIGQAITRQKAAFPANALFFQSTEDFLQHCQQLDFINESILVKGARMFGFERIVETLQQKKHETVLEINLDALVHNLNHYKGLSAPTVKLMAMVKAFSYGSGSFEIANLLQYHRVDYLAVAYTDEGVELRKAGISLPIMVMNPEESGFEDLFRYGLEPEVYNFRSLQLLQQAAERCSGVLSLPVKIHIKMDTGMKRLGFEEEEVHRLTQQLSDNQRFRVCSIFSHLAASEDTSQDNFTLQQIDTFERICHQFERLLGYRFLRHILNSAGISRFPDAQFDMVRLGIGLYGVGSNTQEQQQLQHVSTLKSVISQIKKIKPGETIGYNRSHHALQEKIIATVPVGYADGLSRSLSNGGYSLMVGDRLAPIIGNISMDMCMIDITDIPALEGDEVIVFSPDYPIMHFAGARNTIPYEVLTSISRRVKRVYYRE